jgi:hypothetical protein
VVAELFGLRARERDRAPGVDGADGLERLRGLRVDGLAHRAPRHGLGLGLGVRPRGLGVGARLGRRIGRQVRRFGLVIGRFVVERRPARLVVVAEVVAVGHGPIVVHGRLVARRLAPGGWILGVVAGRRLVARGLLWHGRLVGQRGHVAERHLVARRVIVASRRRGGLLRRRPAFALGATALAFQARGLAIGGTALAAVVAASEEGHQPVTSRAWRTSQSSSRTAAARESSLVRPGERAAMAVVKRSS